MHYNYYYVIVINTLMKEKLTNSVAFCGRLANSASTPLSCFQRDVYSVTLMECFLFKVNAGQEMNQRSNTVEMVSVADALPRISCHVLTTPTIVLGRTILTGYTVSKKVSRFYEVRNLIKTVISFLLEGFLKLVLLIIHLFNNKFFNSYCYLL